MQLVEAGFFVVVVGGCTTALIVGGRVGVDRLRGRETPVTRDLVFSSAAWGFGAWWFVTVTVVIFDPEFQARSGYWSLVYSLFLVAAIAATVLWRRERKEDTSRLGSSQAQEPSSPKAWTAKRPTKDTAPTAPAPGRPRGPPAGWYPDPTTAATADTPPRMRWFDGDEWTGATVQTHASVDDPAGWYPDPWSPDFLRYWDGDDWTNRTLRWGTD